MKDATRTRVTLTTSKVGRSIVECYLKILLDIQHVALQHLLAFCKLNDQNFDSFFTL